MSHHLVVNIRKVNEYDVYVGRASHDKHFGNPFSHQGGTQASVIVGSRDAAVQAYDDWLNGVAWQPVEPERRQWVLDNLHTLRGQTLGCYCAPQSCHGDVLARMANDGPEDVLRRLLAAAMQQAWNEFCLDAGNHPDCFEQRGGMLYADFGRGNFAGMVAGALRREFSRHEAVAVLDAMRGERAI